MSILPSQYLGPTSSSSSQVSPQNSNSNHGAFSQPSESPITVSNQTQILSSIHISASDSPKLRSGSMASSPEYSSASSQKVSESGKRSGRKSLAHQNDGTNPQHQSDTGKSSAGTDSPNSQQSSRFCSLGTSMHSGGRKTHMINGNHLLNFQYDPISRPQPRAPPPRRHPKRKPYNKDLFLQANYKFVVLDSGNYAPESMDPDKMLQWEDIICVKHSSPFFIQCPICLEEPLCPQITSCGHIFCFPCILQYLLMGKDDPKGECWNKCPLCFMMISSKDLYTIYIEKVKQYSIGDTIELMLLTRKKDSFVLSLKNNQGLDDIEEARNSFSKFTFTLDVDLAVRKAMSDLDGWLARADSGLVDDIEKLPYVSVAMDQLEQRKKYWNEHRASTFKSDDYCPRSHGSPPSESLSNNELPEFVWGSLGTSFSNKAKCLVNSTLDKAAGEPRSDQTIDLAESLEDQNGALSSSYDDDKNMETQFGGFRDVKDNDSYTFYQVLDGQHLILHPLNMKCLLHHYGSFNKLPNRINGKILQLETVTQSEGIRRRFRYLSHFSLTTIFQFCEIDVSEMLPPDSLSPFMEEIKNREKQRKWTARKEEHQKLKAEAAASYFASMPHDCLSSLHDESTTFSMDDFEALGSSTVTSSTPQTVGERQSFSSVTRLGFAAGHDSLPKTSVSGSRNSINSPSFANVISRAKTVEPEPSRTNEIGKKGKKQSRVLFSTAGVRRY